MNAIRSSASIALIVDDDPDSIHMVSTMLEENGTTVLVARDGKSALDLVQRVQPDVILLDAIMPEMDGFDTCRLLRAPPLNVAAPIIFMTGLSDTEHVLKGLRAGGIDYVTKPVNVEELLARVTIHTVNSRLMQSAQTALDSEGRAVLAFTAEGKLLWATPNSRVIFAEVGLKIQPGQAAPEPVLSWLLTVQRQPVSRATALTESGVALNFIGTDTRGAILTRLNRASPIDRIGLLEEKFSLTRREAEVLLWLTQGKTNRDIGEILELSGRTINKHLEQVYQKMGVDNRTSAALAADRTLWN